MPLQQHQSNPTRIANEVGMLRSGMSGPIVLVEGSTDTRLFRRLFAPSPGVRVIHCKGKSNLLKAVEKIGERNIPGVLGICDADFDRILGTQDRDGIILVDYHDTEMMIYHSPALPHFCAELYEREFDIREIERTRSRLMGYSTLVGKMRFWSMQNGGPIGFKALYAGEFLDGNGEFDLEACIKKLSAGKSVDAKTLSSIAKMRDFAAEAEISCGHDFTSLIDSDAANRKQSHTFGNEVVEKMLRLSFDRTAFESTKMYTLVRSWEHSNRMKLILD